MPSRKKKRTNFPQKNKIDDFDNEVDDIDPESEDFFQDEIDKFHAQREKSVLADESDEESYKSDEQEVLDVEDSDVSEDESMEEDEEEDEEDDLPSSQAWGKKKSLYYGAESVEGLQGIDRDAVEDAEEQEALKIQQRLAEEIDEDQFQLFDIPLPVEADTDSSKQDTARIPVDVSSLSTKAQWKLLKQESPELTDLIADFKSKSQELKQQIFPLMNLVKTGKITDKGAIYVQTKCNLYVAYLMNISFYMSLKAKRQSLSGHPVVKRLVQYKTLINKLSRVDESLETEIEELTSQNEPTDDVSIASSIEPESENESDDDQISSKQVSSVEPELKENIPQSISSRDVTALYRTLTERLQLEEEKSALASTKEESIEGNIEDENRRAITYTMDKNKGLKAKKRKIDRNPRVKHREKYRKAKIRRKGQVRAYRPELEKYSGEASGIRAGVIRGVRIR